MHPTEIDPAALRAEVAGLAFPEGLRWHRGALWFSDIAAGTVLRLVPGQPPDVMLHGLDRPSGLGWLPDGSLLVVEGGARRLLRHDGATTRVHAELGALAAACCNDMVVDADGFATVGHWGFDFVAGEPPRAASLIGVALDGRARTVAEGLMFPNACAISPDGTTLLVAESWAARLAAFTRGDDGSLGARRVWAALGRAAPDGIALDAEGALWIASPTTREVLRVREGGGITHRIRLDADPLAVALGGADRRTLYIAAAPLLEGPRGARRFVEPARSRALAAGWIASLRVDVAGAGWP